MPNPTDRCARCRHAYTFHQKRADAPCRAMGCRKGPDRAPCPGFVTMQTPGRPEFRAPPRG